MNPPDSLFALSYVSQSTIPGVSIHHEPQDIEQTAVRRNAQLNITGKLIYRLGHFMQRLEGPQQALEDTMDRITTDRRHRNVNMIAWEPIEARVFADWQQLIVVTEGPELDDLDAILGFLVARPVFSVRPMEADVMLSALSSVSTSSAH
ncbi:MAG: BLUF domain-containing protein [Pseudomonadota bacterium]